MSIRSLFSPLVRAACGTRSTKGKVTIMLAACVTCFAASANAAPANPVEFTAAQFLPRDLAAAADQAPTSFASRFEYAEASLSRGIIERLIYPVPMVPIEQASLPRREQTPPIEQASLPRREMTLPVERTSLPRRQKIVSAGPAIAGTASMYNPSDATDSDAGNYETASGERYDVNDWTAAIRTDLRKRFGGVGFGKNFHAVFALVQTADKQAIVRINDVGRLKPGRIIDLNARAMRYFDPTLQLGLLHGVKVTPLLGQQWALGPVIEDRPVSVASRN